MSELLWSYLKFHFKCQRMIDWFQVSWAQISVSFPTTGLSFFFNGFASGKFFMLIHIQSPILFFFIFQGGDLIFFKTRHFIDKYMLLFHLSSQHQCEFDQIFVYITNDNIAMKYLEISSSRQFSHSSMLSDGWTKP